ncbi:ABC transporter substrate-binding protein [Cohnella terricola]|uniref:ABC transporter substrate-binding protein n=1 Tax=Cohnella terricola TaxID=1289167 RepID=A0A559J4J3_9BACL|nr:ABC transporter substrate-binding protein [Cohnella terricola]TVX94808.1 ABC transporter substrate-binding protein [Cohnella terricola]
MKIKGYGKMTALAMVTSMIVLLTAACGNGSNNKGNAGSSPNSEARAVTGERVELTFWNGFTGPDRPAYEALVQKFNDSQPNIHVKMDITPWDTLLAKLPTSWMTGEGPDMAAFSYSLIPKYAKSNLILPLDELYKGDLTEEMFPQGLTEVLKYEGKWYAAPANFATLMLYYNKDLFKAAGLDPEKPPTTWAEWQDAIIKTTKTSGNDKQYGLVLADHATIPMWPILVWGNGGDFEAEGQSKMLDPKTVEAFKVWSDLVNNKEITPTGLTGAEADKLFQSGKAAMEMNGPWMTAGYTSAGLNYDVAPIPVGPGGPVTLADSVALVAGKNTKHKAEILAFMKFWNSKESQEYLSLNSGFPPTRTDMLDNEKLKENAFVPKFAATSSSARFYLSGLENYANINDEAIVPAIQFITINKKIVEEVLQNADKTLSGLLSGK